MKSSMDAGGGSGGRGAGVLRISEELQIRRLGKLIQDPDRNDRHPGRNPVDGRWRRERDAFRLVRDRKGLPLLRQKAAARVGMS
jgi:hypothetical protein